MTVTLVTTGRLARRPLVRRMERMDSQTTRKENIVSEFLWGMASAAYQVEGARNIDGKDESNWDRCSHAVGKIKGGATEDISCDQYHFR